MVAPDRKLVTYQTWIIKKSWMALAVLCEFCNAVHCNTSLSIS
uniref:Uncharacterized protein n=1 Tax=Anguilla anguilla TaxID=7936 RepID=A0A0E9PT56_ANGAN